jgi:hypothetical protein
MRKVIKIIFIVIFFIIGISLITLSTTFLCLNYYRADQKWIPIIYIIFGAMLLLSPIFLKQ